MLAPSSREPPTLYMSEYGFSHAVPGYGLSAEKSDMIVMFGGAVETNEAGGRPPYGSGYDGLRMLMLFCRSAPSSPCGTPFMITLYCRPAATRTTVWPSSLTSHASPSRGDQLLVSPREPNSTNGSGRG